MRTSIRNCNLNTPALVIIDMQETFGDSFNKKTIHACIREVRATKRQNGAIFLVEFDSCGPTDKAITDVIGDYPYCITVTKCEDDGSIDLVRSIRENFRNKTPQHLRVCGVNTDCCVASTVRGLRRFPTIKKIEMVADACGSNQDSLRGAWIDFCWEVTRNKQRITAVNIPKTYPTKVRNYLRGQLNSRY